MSATIIKTFVVKESHYYTISVHVKRKKFNFHLDSIENLNDEVLKNIKIDSEIDLKNDYKIFVQYDLPSFFRAYEVINTRAFSKRIGMNPALLSQYIQGVKKPSRKQVERILTGLNELGKELTRMKF